MNIKNILLLLLFITSLHLLITPVRFLLGFNPNSIILAFYMLISLIFFIVFLTKRFYMNLKKIEVFIILLPILSLLITFVVGKPLSHYVVMDIIKPILFIATIVVFKNINIQKLCNLGKQITYLMYLILISGISSIFLLVYFYLTQGGFYLSATSILILIPTLYFIVKDKKIPILISFIGILYSGKRGVLLALLISIFVMYIAQVKNYKKLMKFWSFVIIGIIGFIVLWNTGKLDNILVIKKMLSAFYTINEEGKSILYAFGGRAEEVIGAIKIFYKEPILLLTGAGPGYTYSMKTVFGLDLKDVHGVHFSPVGIFTIYGPVFFIVMYWYLLKNLKRAYIVLKKYNGNCALIKTAALFVIANFINSFTAFAIFTPIYFAIFIGLINNIHLKKEMK